MTLFFRCLQTLVSALFRSKISSTSEIVENEFRVLPIDIDVYRHMNNAKYFNYMEAVRWGFMLRCGFLKASIKYGWIGPVASMHIEYYRPLTLLQKFKVSTQYVHFEENWYFALHRFWSNEKEMARALVKGTVRKGRQNVPPGEYLKIINLNQTNTVLAADISVWVHGHIASQRSQK